MIAPGGLTITAAAELVALDVLKAASDAVGGAVEAVARRAPWILRWMARLAPATGRR
jgi:hypothetical protein